MATSLRRVVSRILVAWMGFIALGPIVHDGLGHDEDCAPALVLHDPSRHSIGAAPFAPLQGKEHCVVCHLFCGSRYTAAASATVDAAVSMSVVPSIEPQSWHVGVSTSRFSDRAPPAHS